LPLLRPAAEAPNIEELAEITIPETQVQNFKARAIEIAASVWLALVALGYVSRYYLGLDVDFSWAYLVMLLVVAAGVSLSVVKRLEAKGKKP
jgi:cytochrome c oxidase subunit IV